MWAARCWVTDGPGLFDGKEGAAVSDARAMGADEETIAEIRDALAAGGEQDGVWPEHVAAVSLFLAVATQWRVIAVPTMDGVSLRRIGLDYPAVEATARIIGISIDGDLFHALQILEHGALAALNERGN